MQNIIIRVLGLIGLILCVIPFQFKKHKGIVLCKMASELTFACQYFLMGAHTGAWMDLVSGARNFLFYRLVKNKKSTLPVIIIFSCFVTVVGILSWDGAISILPIAAKVITTVAYGMKNERILRYITMPSCILWITYNILVGGWEAMIADALSLVSILTAVYKFDILPKKSKQQA